MPPDSIRLQPALLAFEARAHEFLAGIAFQLLRTGLLVAVRHALLLLLLRLRRAGIVAAQAAAHEFLARVAFHLLGAGLLVAIGLALLLLLLRFRRSLGLVLRQGQRGCRRQHQTTQPHHPLAHAPSLLSLIRDPPCSGPWGVGYSRQQHNAAEPGRVYFRGRARSAATG